MRVIDLTYFDSYSKKTKNVADLLATFLSTAKNQEITYKLNVSAVYSSNIEGNTMSINSFMNSITRDSNYLKKKNEVEEIKDLSAAYDYARHLELNQASFLEAHQILSKTFLIKDKRGVYRTEKMGVFDDSGLIYFALEADKVPAAMNSFFSDIDTLLERELNEEEVFYHASLIHLKFVHIHPFWDGNGRAARLLEKWFLAQKLGNELWKLPSEKYYKENLKKYYNHINLGNDFYNLDYSKCEPFLLMLPQTLR